MKFIKGFKGISQLEQEVNNNAGFKFVKNKAFRNTSPFDVMDYNGYSYALVQRKKEHKQPFA